MSAAEKENMAVSNGWSGLSDKELQERIEKFVQAEVNRRMEETKKEMELEKVKVQPVELEKIPELPQEPESEPVGEPEAESSLPGHSQDVEMDTPELADRPEEEESEVAALMKRVHELEAQM